MGNKFTLFLLERYKSIAGFLCLLWRICSSPVKRVIYFTLIMLNSINQSYAREIRYDGPDDLYYTYYPQIYYKSTSLNCYIGVFDFL